MSDTSSVKSDELVVDAVFVIGTGSKNNNEELKYALRNLDKNCPFIRDVYISGECPEWVDTSVVKHLKWPDRFKHAKDANIIDKLRHACEQPGISENILFCSDDQFQTRECTWADFSPRWLRQYVNTDPWYESRKRIWHSRLHRTLERDRKRRIDNGFNSDDVFYYQPHIWMQIDRDKFLAYAQWSNYETRDDTIIASGYFNFINAGGSPNYDHVFISQNQKWPVNVTHVAYSDSSYNAAMTYLKSTFTEPSRFEKVYKKDSVEKDVQSIEDKIDYVKRQIFREPVWHALISDVTRAEQMRSADAPEWEYVWKDIIERWESITEHGSLKIPVATKMGVYASSAVRGFIEHSTANRIGPTESTVSSRTSAQPEEKKHCSKCEERKRRAREEAEMRKTEAIAAVKEAIASTAEHESESCIDCAIEHLATATAYLSSNVSRPTALDIELSKGEIRVAAQHLLALKRNEEYNRCIEVLDSADGEKSQLSAVILRDILKQVIG